MINIFVLTILNIFNYLDRYLVNALLPIISSEFGLNYTQGGQVVSAFVFGYVIFSPIFGFFGDRLHRPTLLFIGVSLWVLATCATGWAVGFFSLIAARIFVGVGEASYGTIGPGYIKDFISDPLRLNRTLSFFFAAIPVGAALGYVVGGVLIQYMAWQKVFYCASIPAFFIAWYLLKFPEKEGRVPPKGTVVDQFLEIVRDKFVLWVIAGYIFNTFALTGIASFVSTYGQQLGFSLTEINNYFGGILVICGFAGTLLGGRLAGNFGSKTKNPCIGMLRFVALASALAVPILFLTFLAEDKYLFLILCACVELCIFAGIAPINSIIVLSCPPSLVTMTQGFTILCINIFGTLLGPLCIGIIADILGLSLALQISTLAMALCAFIWWSQARRG